MLVRISLELFTSQSTRTNLCLQTDGTLAISLVLLDKIKYLFENYAKRIKGDAEYVLKLSLKYGSLLHYSSNKAPTNDQSFRKYWLTYRFKKSSFYSSFDMGGSPNLFSAVDKDYHSRIKKLILPAFSVKTLNIIEKAIYDIGSQGLVNYIQSNIKSSKNEIFDLFNLFHCATFDVITQIVFGTSFSTSSNKDKATFYINSLGDTQKALFFLILFPDYKHFRISMKIYFSPLSLKMLVKRKQPKARYFTILIDSKHPETGEKHSKLQIAVECGTFLFAEMDTDTNILTWDIYTLLRNPDINN